MHSKKTINEFIEEGKKDNKLERTLNAFNLTTLGIGAIIGAGIFVLTGHAAAEYAGPGITISFIMSGFACVFAALCYAELASLIPIAGSAYTYAYASFGRFVAWLIGWDLILEYLFSASTVAVGWSGYVTSFLKDFGIKIPYILSNAPFYHSAENGWELTGAVINLPAVFIIALLTILLVLGVKESARFNNLMVIIKVIVILLFIFFGIGYIIPDNLTPFIPENKGEFGQFGWSGILRGSAVIFFAYIGFDAVSTAAQESKNPQRDMPIGILISLVISTILYIAVALVLTGIVNYEFLNVPDPISVGIDATGNQLFWLRPIIKVGAIAGLSSVILVMLLSQPRVFYSMAKDGLLPSLFAKVHPKFKTPYVTTFITGLIALTMAGLFPIGILGELVSIGTLFAFIVVCIGVIILRYKQPHLNRPFKAPWFPLVPIMGVGTSMIQMIALPIDTWLRLIIWMGIGLAIYYFYGVKKT